MNCNTLIVHWFTKAACIVPDTYHPVLFDKVYVTYQYKLQLELKDT